MDYFGIREVCNVTLRALRNIPACRSLTGVDIRRGQPVMYFDFLKVSNISGSVSTVYATGGRGNARRLSWDGDKEVTFHIEDALISPTSMAILTAAQLVRRRIARVNKIPQFGLNIGQYLSFSAGQNRIELPPGVYDPLSFMSWGVITVETADGEARVFAGDIEIIQDGTGQHSMIISQMRSVDTNQIISNMEITNLIRMEVLEATAFRPVYKHEKNTVTAIADGQLQLRHTPWRDANHPLFIFDVQEDGSIDLIAEIETLDTGPTGVMQPDAEYWKSDLAVDPNVNSQIIQHPHIYKGNDYLVDYYREVRGNVTSLVITADGTSDYYMLEAETLMRREADGQDIPVMLTMPKVKPRAQFEIPMSATGDPSTFSFDFDVFPARNPNFEACEDNVMVIIDIIEDDDGECLCTYDQLDIWNRMMENKRANNQSVHYDGRGNM